jgi:hypothetical protein
MASGGQVASAAATTGLPDRMGTWSTISSLADAPDGAFPFFDTSKTYASYYVMDFFPGSGDRDFIAVVPTPVDRYSLQPVPGVSI